MPKSGYTESYYDANAKAKATQGNAQANEADHARCFPRAIETGNYDARSTARCKIALNCWFPSCLRLYRKLYSFRYDCRYLVETE